MNANTRRIRVLYIVPDLGIGGAERHVTTLMPSLDAERFEPYVICIGEEGDLFDTLTAAGVPATALHRDKRQAVAALWDLLRELRTFAPDVVITRGYIAEALGRIAAAIVGVRSSVVWVHNHGDTKARSHLRRIADRILDRSTRAYFGVAHAQSKYMTDDLGYPAGKVAILHNGVDPSLYDPFDDRRGLVEFGIGDSEPVVGIVAAMRPEKDHSLFLEAASLVLLQMPAAKFLIIGDGALRAQLEREAAERKISDRVVFAGARSDIADLMPALDVFVLCSYSVECFPMALLEAMASGRAAVCTAVGGVPEMLADGETGYLVPPRNATALADKITTLLRDPGLRRRMGAAARRRVENEFSLRASVSAAEVALSEISRLDLRQPCRPVVLTVVLDMTFVGGVEMLLLQLFQHFDPAVVRPRIVCLREAGPLAPDFRAAGFEVKVLNRTGRLGANRLRSLISDFRESRTDVVLVAHHHRAALLLGRLAARRLGIASVVAAHDMDLASVGGRVFPRWAVDTLWLSQALVLLSPGQRAYLRREEGVGRGPASTIREVVIPNGIVLPPRVGDDRQAARTLLGLNPDDFAVGIVARLSAQKSHQVLFKAVADLSGTHASTTLIVIGAGERETELRRLSRELGIDSRTKFLGERRDVPRLLPGLDVSCLSSSHEGVPMIMIESMAANLPVVATDCGSLSDLVVDGDNGFLVPVGDPQSLAARLGMLADDPSLRAAMGERGRDLVERCYRITDTARQYERLLTELADGKVARVP